MKKVILLSVLVVFLVLSLIGCGVTPATNEIRVKNIIQEYFLAINDQNWTKAKNYCVYESDVYYETCNLEQDINSLILQYEVVTIAFIINEISNVSIHNNYAQAYIDGVLTISYDSISDSSDGTGYLYLEKIGNSWKIYDINI